MVLLKIKKYQIRANSVKSCLLFLNALVQKIHIDGTDNIKKKINETQMWYVEIFVFLLDYNNH